ncbi:MAG: NADH-quinone oxidoreductase subunit C [Campylobacterales bacterium]|nr:NADH-quinone oxidoreductase subunit C [Campylobacterales bacterium]
MNKITVNLENVVETIKAFYNPAAHHFLTLNALNAPDDSIELEWIFTRYGVIDEPTVFTLTCKRDVLIPSVTSFIPSAIMSERETVDMFGVSIEGAKRGLYLDEDSREMPLGRCRV